MQGVLDERRLRVAPREANVDDRRYPAVVENGLKKCPQGQLPHASVMLRDHIRVQSR